MGLHDREPSKNVWIKQSAITAGLCSIMSADVKILDLYAVMIVKVLC